MKPVEDGSRITLAYTINIGKTDNKENDDSDNDSDDSDKSDDSESKNEDSNNADTKIANIKYFKYQPGTEISDHELLLHSIQDSLLSILLNYYVNYFVYLY